MACDFSSFEHDGTGVGSRCKPGKTDYVQMQTFTRILLALALSSLAGGCLFFRPDTPSDESENDNLSEIANCVSNMALVVTNRPSPNFDQRKLPVNLIVLHYTAAPLLVSLNTLVNGCGNNRVSAHYLVDENGNVYRLVDETKRAWHAGVANWDGITDVNSASVGIEIVNSGLREDGRFHPFQPVQVNAVAKLCLDIQTRHDIKAVVGHSDVAPRRKIDPGPLFPWKVLKTCGVNGCAH